VKRGLVVLDPAEVPAGEWQARNAALRSRLAAEGMDFALVYGDVFASDDIAYLTNLCIYWNEGMLAVPASGDAVFLTKLSPRVHPWMRRVSTVERIESGKSFGALVTRLLGELPSGTVGLVGAARWPAALVAEVRAALPGWRVRELGELVGERREVVSGHELALLRRGGAVVGRAAAEAAAPGLGAYARTAVVERLVRGAGFLDVQTHVAQAPDGVACVQVTGQFRTGWLHASRLANTAGRAWAEALREALEAAVGAVRAGASGRELTAAAAAALARLPEGSDAQVRWVNQADLATAGEYRRRAADEPLPAGSVVAVSVDVLFESGGYAALGDTVLVTDAGADALTAAHEEAVQ
jgi:Xaa-Pro aminopeptidase